MINFKLTTYRVMSCKYVKQTKEKQFESIEQAGQYVYNTFNTNPNARYFEERKVSNNSRQFVLRDYSTKIIFHLKETKP